MGIFGSIATCVIALIILGLVISPSFRQGFVSLFLGLVEAVADAIPDVDFD